MVERTTAPGNGSAIASANTAIISTITTDVRHRHLKECQCATRAEWLK
jgi:hypothetical protein